MRGIKVVGPCASGKSLLVTRLCELGYEASAAAQEHSYVPDMWQRISPPGLLIYLDVGLAEMQRRGHPAPTWDQEYLDQQHRRLEHARAHCDFYLCTDGLGPDEVLAKVLHFLDGAAEIGPERVAGAVPRV